LRGKRERGFTLISVLITTAIGGILAALILGLVDQASRMLVRGSALDVYEGVMRTTSGLLANKEYCGNALRGATPATQIVYNVHDNPVGPPPGGNEVNITNIYIQANPNPNHPIVDVYSNPGATALVSTVAGSSLNNIYGNVRVNYIRFREKERAVGRSILRFNGLDYVVYRGEIEIDVTGLSSTGGGTVRRRIPYHAVVHPVNRTIDGCYVQDSSVDYMCRSLGGTFNNVTQTCDNINANPAAINCQAECNPTNVAPPGPSAPTARCQDAPAMTDCDTPSGPGFQCVPMYYVKGFNVVTAGASTTADPICGCQRLCWTSSGATASAASTAAAAATATATATAASAGAAPAAPASSGN